LMAFKKVAKARLTELFTRGVAGFHNSVDVEETQIARADTNFRSGVSGFGKKAEHYAILFDLTDIAVRSAGEEQRGVACAGITEGSGLPVNKNVRGGDEMLFKLSTQCAI